MLEARLEPHGAQNVHIFTPFSYVFQLAMFDTRSNWCSHVFAFDFHACDSAKTNHNPAVFNTLFTSHGLHVMHCHYTKSIHHTKKIAWAEPSADRNDCF